MKRFSSLASAVFATLCFSSSLALAQGVVAPSSAPPPTVSATAAREPAFVLGVQLGMGFPQPFSELRNFGVYTFEVGYAVPGWGRRVQLGASFSYSEPGAGGQNPDPRFSSAGNFGFNLTQREYVLDFGVLIRAFPLGTRFNAYGRAGFRVYLLDSVVNGQAGSSSFGQYNETFTEPGFALGGGIELRLGPGAFLAELRLEYSGLDRRLTGASNSGMLTLGLGYRFFL